jgi:hypothetical protein
VLKTAATMIASLSLFLAPVTAGATPCPSTRANCAVPEPSAIPEMGLLLAAIAVGFWLFSRTRKPVQ